MQVCAVQDILYMLGDHLLLSLQSVILALENCSTRVDVHYQLLSTAAFVLNK